jgi:prepilin signal peptidase PulO-like enzyme (type II secretory pathway)
VGLTIVPILSLIASANGITLNDIPYNFPYNEALQAIAIASVCLLMHGIYAWTIDWWYPWQVKIREK